MRGKLPEELEIDDVKRITPADAGKTPCTKVTFPRSTDHPRGCGENVFCFQQKISDFGSPPRMRGKLGADETATTLQRITPADAGKTVL